ncbi:hypothetical protein J6590_071290 [Homalodisca vitripennis]|nr:hypothetical protein J6590_071290 [Homalodisca vitripennis]
MVILSTVLHHLRSTRSPRRISKISHDPESLVETSVQEKTGHVILTTRNVTAVSMNKGDELRMTCVVLLTRVSGKTCTYSGISSTISVQITILQFQNIKALSARDIYNGSGLFNSLPDSLKIEVSLRVFERSMENLFNFLTTRLSVLKALQELQITTFIELNSCIQYFAEMNLETNQSKSNVVHFCLKQNELPERPAVFVDGVLLEETYSTKFLRLFLDRGLTWDGHVDNMCARISAGIHALAHLA